MISQRILQPVAVAIPVYVLTNVGAAISTILPDQQARALSAYIEQLRPHLPSTAAVLEYRNRGLGFLPIRGHPGTGAAVSS